jgi:hypothetical protein
LFVLPFYIFKIRRFAMSRTKRIQAGAFGFFIALALSATPALAQSNSSAQAGDAANTGASMAEQGKQKGEARSKDAKKQAKQERKASEQEMENAEDRAEMKEKGGQGKADPGNKGSEKGIEKKRENAKSWWNFWG